MVIEAWIVTSFGLLALTVALALAWFLTPFVIRRYQEQQWDKICRDEGVIVMTFDDGPGERLTEKLLSLLDVLGISASFFVIGSRAIAEKQKIGLIEAGKHDVGSHTENHLNAWKSLPSAHCMDMIHGHDQVESLVGRTTLFRPPYGKMTLASFLIAKMRNWDIVWWTVDARDSLEVPKSHDEVLAEIRRNGGGIVLLHDYDNFPDENHEEYVLELVPKIQLLAEELSLRFVTFTQFMRLVESRTA